MLVVIHNGFVTSKKLPSNKLNHSRYRNMVFMMH